jgi:hypothetical protein
MSRIISMKVMFNRVKEYLAAFQFVMVAYLFIVQTQFNIITTSILILLGCSALALFDWKMVLPKEQQKMADINPAWMDAIHRLERIEKMINSLGKK